MRNRSHAPKKHKPLLLRNKPLTNRGIIHIHKEGTCTFYQIQIFADTKKQSMPIQKNTPKCHIRFVSHFYYIICFDICKYFQRIYMRLPFKNNNINSIDQHCICEQKCKNTVFSVDFRSKYNAFRCAYQMKGEKQKERPNHHLGSRDVSTQY